MNMKWQLKESVILGIINTVLLQNMQNAFIEISPKQQPYNKHGSQNSGTLADDQRHRVN